MRITAAVVAYQVAISSSIVGASKVGGRGFATVVAIGWSIWTLTHVILPPLAIIQYVNIVGSWFVAMGTERE